MPRVQRSSNHSSEPVRSFRDTGAASWGKREREVGRSSPTEGDADVQGRQRYGGSPAADRFLDSLHRATTAGFLRWTPFDGPGFLLLPLALGITLGNPNS
ncbi:hypothetical protein Taro_026204 [Colocasia esculenta]|uniref:Uncharacterized protein n=1 Tax=Colocasia esculenta TaxID=4460 RepID=A0A843VMY0_COLES|nr:hypothetical protein [Colocasia esculenta]